MNNMAPPPSAKTSQGQFENRSFPKNTKCGGDVQNLAKSKSALILPSRSSTTSITQFTSGMGKGLKCKPSQPIINPYKASALQFSALASRSSSTSITKERKKQLKTGSQTEIPNQTEQSIKSKKIPSKKVGSKTVKPKLHKTDDDSAVDHRPVILPYQFDIFTSWEIAGLVQIARIYVPPQLKMCNIREPKTKCKRFINKNTNGKRV